MSKYGSFLAGFVVVFMGVGVAAGGPGLSWVFQDTMVPSNGMGLALGMRGGYVWPVIFSGERAAISLPTGWQEVKLGLGLGEPYEFAGVASSPTGEVAAWSRNFGPGGGRGVVSGPAGWEYMPADAMAFDSQGNLWKAIFGEMPGDQQIGYRDSSGWHSLPSIDGYPPLRAIAVASNGEVGAINESQYYHYSALAGGWTGPQDFGAPEMPGWIENAVLAFDNHDIPHIVGRYDEGGGVVGVAFDFDIRTGKWVMSNLPLSDNVNGILPIASDGQGTVGTAYVSNGQLIYARNVDNSGWEAFVLPTGGGEIPIPSPTGVGLAYDYEGIPVIAYSANQSLWLAYDPVVVPEPLTVTMLAIGGLVLCRRRRG